MRKQNIFVLIEITRRDRKIKAIAEALEMFADTHPELVPIGRILSARQTNGCGRAPPNFAPRWTAMQSALWKLKERIERRQPRQPPGLRRVAPLPHRLSIYPPGETLSKF